jgi:hypothetical protein
MTNAEARMRRAEAGLEGLEAAPAFAADASHQAANQRSAAVKQMKRAHQGQVRLFHKGRI